MKNNSSGRKIAKNTIYLYIRMMFTMVVTLYTSRVILDKLGVDDYGIYQSVGGIVGLLAFVKGALATGASRFLTFELGRNDSVKLKTTFSTVLNIHIFMAIIIALFAETLGLWFVCNKLVIAPERMDAAIYAYHLSILAAIFSLIEVPYNATIIAHERMSIYAYMSILEVCAKLGICYMLTIGGFDKLMIYATLLLLIQIAIPSFYMLYCRFNFNEARYSFVFNQKISKEILSFSGWSLFAHGSLALNSQGILILLNMFFSPAIVTARAVSIQVNMAATHFVSNFRVAVNPQIVKRLAAGDVSGSHNLLLSSTRYSFYLMLMLCLPMCLLADPLLHLWLKEVPEYTCIFLQLILIQSLFQVFDNSFYTALYAMGRLRENALISPTFGFIRFPIIYLLFKLGFSPVALSWASLITYAILGLLVKPMLIIRIADYSVKDIISVFVPCLYVTLASLPVPLYMALTMDVSQIENFILIVIASTIAISLSTWFLGVEKATKQQIISWLQVKANKIVKK